MYGVPEALGPEMLRKFQAFSAEKPDIAPGVQNTGGAAKPAVGDTGSDTATERGAANTTEHAPQSTVGSSSLEQGLVHAGQYYAGVVARRLILTPPNDFCIPQPQLWVQ